MNVLKFTVGSTMASAAMLLAPAVPVAADTVIDSNNTTTNTVTTTVDESKTIHVGQCAVRFDDIKVWLDQYNKNDSDQNNLNAGGLPYLHEENGSGNGGSTTQSNSSSQSQSNSQTVTITVAPNCSVTNVTQVAASSQSGQVLGTQAEAAKGGVGAGFGAVPSVAATIGALGSAAGIALGIRRFGR